MMTADEFARAFRRVVGQGGRDMDGHREHLTDDELAVIERDHARIVGSPPGAIEWWMLSGYC